MIIRKKSESVGLIEIRVFLYRLRYFFFMLLSYTVILIWLATHEQAEHLVRAGLSVTVLYDYTVNLRKTEIE